MSNFISGIFESIDDLQMAKWKKNILSLLVILAIFLIIGGIITGIVFLSLFLTKASEKQKKEKAKKWWKVIETNNGRVPSYNKINDDVSITKEQFILLLGKQKDNKLNSYEDLTDLVFRYTSRMGRKSRRRFWNKHHLNHVYEYKG